MTVKSRQRIEYRLTTCPADFGYEGTPSRWLESDPDAVGTINTIMGKRYECLRRAGLLGSGTYYREEFRRGGKTISRDQLDDEIISIEHARANKR